MPKWLTQSAFFYGIMPAPEQSGIHTVLDSQIFIVDKESFIAVFGYFLRRRALIDGNIQSVLALFALVNQPDVQFILVGVYTETPRAEEGHLFSAAAALVDDSVFSLVCIAHRISWFDFPIRRLSHDSIPIYLQ
jgi:hypothetical protein